MFGNQTETYFIIAYYSYRLACHSVYAVKLTGKSVCVVADDTDVFILLLHVSINCNETLYLHQGTTFSKDGITHINVTSLSSQLGEKICAILPAFYSLTDSDFKKPFFGRSKISSFKKLLSKPESIDLMSSMNTDHVDIEKVTHFVLHAIYNRPKREKSPGDSRYAMLHVGKRRKKKFASTKSLPSDQKSLTMKILRAHLVGHSLDSNYQSLDPLSNGWIFVDGALQPLWYEGASLASEKQIQNYLREESEILKGILQDSEEIDENLTDDDYDVVSDNESESDE